MVSIRVIEPPEYAPGLERLPDPPARLYVAGALPSPPSVAIVGTRRASVDGVAFAGQLGRDLAGRGVMVVSGGARGIDVAAHRGALEAGGGTVVVFGGPLDRPYPARHRALFQSILDADGGWISEVAPGAPTYRSSFLRRNRIIAALVDVVVVVEAPLRSGALSTARHARRLGVPVLVMPGRPGDPRTEGSLALLAAGRAALCRDASDVVAALHDQPAPRVTSRRRERLASHPATSATRSPRSGTSEAPVASLSVDARRVLQAVDRGIAHDDELVDATELPVARVRVALFELTARGLVARVDGVWRLTSRLLRSPR